MSFGMLSDVAMALASPLHGSDHEYRGVSIDSRQLSHDQLFVALKGPTFDGHEYVAAAESSGAAGAVVEQLQDGNLAQIAVDDTRNALGRLAKAWRQKFDIPLIAVTGSNGKTTVKQMMHAIFSLAGETHATRGNLNNDIGLPLTLLELDTSHRYAIVELGANHPGEIAYLTAIAQPDIALVTNAAAAHLEGFGSIDGVAHAKGEIIAGLSSTGTAVINADDAYAPLWHEIAGNRRVVSFAVNTIADISAKDIRTDSGNISFRLQTPDGEEDVRLPVPGAHNVSNALAAAAAAYAQGQSMQDIAAGLRETKLVAGRMQLFSGRAGVQLVDDSYNANPLSFAAAIDYLSGLGGRSWLVMGDMKELGEHAPQRHAAVGRLAKDSGVDRFFCTGQLSRQAADAFGTEAVFDADADSLITTLCREIDTLTDPTEVTILIKASRSMRLERVVDALRCEDLEISAGKGG